MSKYKNDEEVYIDVHTDKYGKDHIDFYDRDPEDEDHKSIHINFDSTTGTGTIIDNTDGEKETTHIGCYLTTACMRHHMNEFDDNCEELTILRWFRDNFVSTEDIEHYYLVAPLIVESLDKLENSNLVYDYIYEKVIKECVNAIKHKEYIFAYNRYKNSVLSLENALILPKEALNKTLKKCL